MLEKHRSLEVRNLVHDIMVALAEEASRLFAESERVDGPESLVLLGRAHGMSDARAVVTEVLSRLRSDQDAI